MSDQYTITIGSGLNVWRNGELVHEVTSRSALMFIAYKLAELLYRGGNGKS